MFAITTGCVAVPLLLTPAGISLEGYTVHPMPLLSGDTSGVANDANEQGQVVGMSTSSSTGSDQRGVLSDLTTTIELSPPGTANFLRSFTNAINNGGVPVGYVDTSTTRTPARWPAGGGTVEQLGVLSGHIWGEAEDVNNSGRVVGYSATSVNGANSAPLFWDPGSTTPSTLALPTGAFRGSAQAINDGGTAVGNTNLGPAAWDTGVNAVLDLSGSFTDASGVTALHLNNDDLAVGSMIKDSMQRPFAVSIDDGSRTDVDFPAAATFALASAVNDDGVIAGYAGLPDGSGGSTLTAYLTGLTGSAVVVNDVLTDADGWAVNVLVGINNDGWLTGYGTFDPDGPGGVDAQVLPVVLKPVPEPATLGLFAGSLLVLRRRR